MAGLPIGSIQVTGLVRFAVALPALAAILLGAAIAAAQSNADSDPLDRRLSRQGSNVKRFVVNPNSDPEAVELYRDFFDKYYFPAMTQTDPVLMGDIATLRYNLVRQFLTPARPEIQKQLTKKAFTFANRIIRRRSADGKPKRYSREATYNAVLLLGDLGSSYSRTETKPYPPANEFLCRISDLAAKKQLPSYMQAGALVGLTRHARYFPELPEKGKQMTLAALLQATTAQALPENVGPKTADWIRARAATGLALIAKSSDEAKAAQALVKLAGDTSLSLETRVAIAGQLNGISLPADPAVAKSVLELAATVGQAEAKQAEAFEDLQVSRGNRETLKLIESPRYRYDQASSKLVLLRAGIADTLDNLRKALQAAAPIAGDLSEPVQSAATAVSAALSRTISEDSIDLDVSAEIKRMAATLAQVSPSADGAEASDDDAGVEGLF